MIKITGLNDIKKNLKKLESNVKKVSGTQSIPFNEIFSYNFMHTNTNSDSIDEFFKCAGIVIQTQEDFQELEERILDEAVVKFTTFNSWEEMIQLASKEYINGKLFDGVKGVKIK